MSVEVLTYVSEAGRRLQREIEPFVEVYKYLLFVKLTQQRHDHGSWSEYWQSSIGKHVAIRVEAEVATSAEAWRGSL